jgi:LPS export ABC transporter protein LptC
MSPKPFWTGKALQLLALAAAVAGAAYWLWPAPPPPPPPPKAESATHSQMESLSLTEIQKGTKHWFLEAKKAKHVKERDEIHLEGVQVDFFEASGLVTRVKCEQGVVHTKTRQVRLQGRVEVARGDLRVVATEAEYRPAERLLVIPGEVILEGPTVKIEGKNLTVDLAKRKLWLSEHRRTEVKVAGGRLLR